MGAQLLGVVPVARELELLLKVENPSPRSIPLQQKGGNFL
jgi:hypothetical protein